MSEVMVPIVPPVKVVANTGNDQHEGNLIALVSWSDKVYGIIHMGERVIRVEAHTFC